MIERKARLGTWFFGAAQLRIEVFLSLSRNYKLNDLANRAKGLRISTQLISDWRSFSARDHTTVIYSLFLYRLEVCGFEYRGKKYSIEHFALVADSGQYYVALGIGFFLFSSKMHIFNETCCCVASIDFKIYSWEAETTWKSHWAYRKRPLEHMRGTRLPHRSLQLSSYSPQLPNIWVVSTEVIPLENCSSDLKISRDPRRRTTPDLSFTSGPIFSTSSPTSKLLATPRTSLAQKRNNPDSVP
jgi:hypothetical protein